ncbi:hypothetical protein L1987_01421 [Smallanthus sonchifolius]|uniref:Uncharacterized protein n=1 Tax=Smallanthus sonchifolius TaxID=185202 RepID=A0ACB9K526_9ASTR|nr:hypothetical protein L1987_01421 [Smallanthus sonchifolius]
MARTFFRKMLTYVSSEDDSDNEDDDGQSSRQRRKFIRRDHIEGHERLFRDYFAENPVYTPKLFRRRFQMSRPLFLRILNEVESNEPYFIQRRNNAGRLGLSYLQKISAALRMMAYGVTGDFMDEYIRIGESTAMVSLKKFSETIVSIFSNEYLRSPNASDITRLFAVAEQRGLLGMLGSIDCMHWKWKNCPSAWKGMYSGHIREPTIILEATIPSPRGNKNKYFAKAQESARKDVERAFGVLQQRFAIIRGPSRMFKVKVLTNIMKACVILHNMIIEDERDDSDTLNIEYDQVDDDLLELSRDHTIEFMDFI